MAPSFVVVLLLSTIVQTTDGYPRMIDQTFKYSEFEVVVVENSSENVDNIVPMSTCMIFRFVKMIFPNWKHPSNVTIDTRNVKKPMIYEKESRITFYNVELHEQGSYIFECELNLDDTCEYVLNIVVIPDIPRFSYESRLNPISAKFFTNYEFQLPFHHDYYLMSRLIRNSRYDGSQHGWHIHISLTGESSIYSYDLTSDGDIRMHPNVSAYRRPGWHIHAQIDETDDRQTYTSQIIYLSGMHVLNLNTRHTEISPYSYEYRFNSASELELLIFDDENSLAYTVRLPKKHLVAHNFIDIVDDAIDTFAMDGDLITFSDVSTMLNKMFHTTSFSNLMVSAQREYVYEYDPQFNNIEQCNERCKLHQNVLDHPVFEPADLKRFRFDEQNPIYSYVVNIRNTEYVRVNYRILPNIYRYREVFYGSVKSVALHANVTDTSIDTCTAIDAIGIQISNLDRMNGDGWIVCDERLYVLFRLNPMGILESQSSKYVKSVIEHPNCNDSIREEFVRYDIEYVNGLRVPITICSNQTNYIISNISTAKKSDISHSTTPPIIDSSENSTHYSPYSSVSRFVVSNETNSTDYFTEEFDDATIMYRSNNSTGCNIADGKITNTLIAYIICLLLVR